MNNALQPLAAQITGEILRCAQVSIHGDLYHDIHLRLDHPDNHEHNLRAPSHACARPPQPGDRVTIHLLLQQVTCIEFADQHAAPDKPRANLHNNARSA